MLCFMCDLSDFAFFTGEKSDFASNSLLVKSDKKIYYNITIMLVSTIYISMILGECTHRVVRSVSNRDTTPINTPHYIRGYYLYNGGLWDMLNY